jgi:5,10-methylenetetrahydromethanopterin reductase
MKRKSERLQLGAMFSPTRPIGELPEFADRIDELGFDQLWFAEDCFEHGAFAAASLALTRMPRTSVGIGLLPVGVRNAAVAAMEIATLANLFPGRLEVTFGHGIESWMRQIGVRPSNRLTYLHGVADVVARLVRGEQVSSESQVVLDHVQLSQVPRSEPSFLIGTTGQQGLNVAVDLGFGLLMPEGSGVEAVRWARRALPPQSRVTMYSWLSVADDSREAEDALLGEVRDWRARELYPSLYDLGGLPEAGAITPQMLSGVAVVGSPLECARGLERLYDAGADAVVFLPIGADQFDSLARLQRDVVPLLHR